MRAVSHAGVLDMAFCAGVGPARYSDRTIAGLRTFALASFRVSHH